jgi:hypothetical protein
MENPTLLRNRGDAPPGVQLVGGLSSPSSKCINSWSAHFGNVCIVRDIYRRKRVAVLAWEWYDKTTPEQREAIMVKTKAEEGMTSAEWRDVVREILMGRSFDKSVCAAVAAMPDSEMSEVLALLVDRGGARLDIIRGNTKVRVFATRV